MKIKEFEGIIVAPLTPDEKHQDVIEELIQFYIERGVRGFFILGTYGEGVKLSVNKRMRLAEQFIDKVNSNVLVILHVGASSLDDVKKLAKHAENLRVDAISAVLPFYHNYDVDSLVKFYNEISKCTDIPLMIYNNPRRQGYSPSIDELKKIMERDSKIVGIKDSSGTLMRLYELLDLKEKYFVAAGGDHLIFHTFLMGIKAHIGAIACIYPELAVMIYKLVKENNIKKALNLQLKVNTIRKLLKSIGSDVASYKYALKLRGVDLGDPLPPTRLLKDEEAKLLVERLAKLDSGVSIKP